MEAFIITDVYSEEGLRQKDSETKGSRKKSCPLGALWSSWCWVELLFLATDGKQGNFVL